MIAPPLPAAHAQAELWHGTKVGMSVDQAKQVVPGWIVPTADKQLKDGSRDLLEAQFEVLGHAARASLYFGAGGLAHVVTNVPLGEESTSQVIALSADLSGLMKQKYGEPFSCGPHNDRGFADYHCEWRTRGTAVSVAGFAAPGMNYLLISYDAAGGDQDNL